MVYKLLLCPGGHGPLVSDYSLVTQVWSQRITADGFGFEAGPFVKNDIGKKADSPYKQILKPTFIWVGSSVINSLLAIVRIKFIALLLGLSGTGLIGIYKMTFSLVSTICGMVISDSGVRQIAEASGRDDHELEARTVLVVRRVASSTE